MFIDIGDEEKIINSLWHGISSNAELTEFGCQTDTLTERLAVSDDEIVMDAHVIEPLDLSLEMLLRLARVNKC